MVSPLGLRFVSLHHFGKPGVLVAHLRPPFSVEVSALSDADVVDRVLDCLSSVFGAASVRGTPLREFVCTRWHQDPLSMGAYSYMPVGATFEDVHLYKRTEGCLLFAGEATSAFDGQCVTGAYNTGTDAAYEVMELLQLRECEGCRLWFPCTEAGAQYFECDACIEAAADSPICLCRQPPDDSVYVECDRCEHWYHPACVGLRQAPSEDDTWVCPPCKRKQQRPRKRRGR